MARAADVEAMIERLRTRDDAKLLRDLIDSVPAEAHAYQPGLNEWSMIRCLQHVGDIEEMRHTRFRRMLEEDTPVLDVVPPSSGERDADDIHALLNRWRKLRQTSLDILMPLTDEQWHRGGIQNPDPQVNRTVRRPPASSRRRTRSIITPWAIYGKCRLTTNRTSSPSRPRHSQSLLWSMAGHGCTTMLPRCVRDDQPATAPYQTKARRLTNDAAIPDDHGWRGHGTDAST
jgi:DinB superfamily